MIVKHLYFLTTSWDRCQRYGDDDDGQFQVVVDTFLAKVQLKYWCQNETFSAEVYMYYYIFVLCISQHVWQETSKYKKNKHLYSCVWHNSFDLDTNSLLARELTYLVVAVTSYSAFAAWEDQMIFFFLITMAWSHQLVFALSLESLKSKHRGNCKIFDSFDP